MNASDSYRLRFGFYSVIREYNCKGYKFSIYVCTFYEYNSAIVINTNGITVGSPFKVFIEALANLITYVVFEDIAVKRRIFFCMICIVFTNGK